MHYLYLTHLVFQSDDISVSSVVKIVVYDRKLCTQLPSYKIDRTVNILQTNFSVANSEFCTHVLQTRFCTLYKQL